MMGKALSPGSRVLGLESRVLSPRGLDSRLSTLNPHSTILPSMGSPS